jgi:hypothetical protein
MVVNITKLDFQNVNDIGAVENSAHDIKICTAELMFQWAEVEQFLSILFHEALKEDYAFDLWHSIISFQAKMKALNAIMSIKLEGNEEKKVWKSLVDTVSKEVAKRNQVAHATLINNNKASYLSPYFSLNPGKQEIKLTAEDLRIRKLFLSDIRDAVSWFISKFNTLGLYEGDLNVPNNSIIIPPKLIRQFQKKNNK